jgi:hypothetical protein
MKALTTWSYKKGFLTLSNETPKARIWAWASTYESNIKPFKGLEWNSFVAKKGSVLHKLLHLNEEHQKFQRKHT